jgi:ABC-type glycerol-3-phosphate transport system substrate-binding protein
VANQHSGFFFIGSTVARNPTYKWNVALPPTGAPNTKGCTGGSGGFTLFRGAKNPEGGWAWVWFANSDESEIRQLNVLSNMSPLPKLNERMTTIRPDIKIDWQAVVDIVKYFKARPYRVGTDDLMTQLVQPALDELSAGRATAAQAMGQIEPQVNAALAKLQDQI